MFLGDLNRNLRMNNYNNNLNSFATDLEKSLYKQHRENLHSMLDSNASVPFSFTTYDSSSGVYNIDALMQQAQAMKNILENTGGTLYGLDMETLGGYGDKSTELEKKLFSVTEIALVKQDVNKNISGMVHGGNRIDDVLLFGIERSQANAYFNLISKAKKDGWGSLSATERSTIERLTRYSGRDVFKKSFNGTYTLNKLSASQPSNLEAARKGVLNLLKVGDVQGFNTKYGRQQLLDLRTSLVDANKSGNMLMTYNGSNFDLPFLNEVFKRNNIEPINVQNHYDARLILNASTQGELQTFVQDVAKANGIKNFKPGKKPGSLEKLAEAFKFDIDAHMAVSDTLATMEIGTDVIPGKGVTVYDYAIDKLSSIKNDPNNRTISNLTKGNTVIYANQAVHIDKNSFDYMAVDGKVQNHIDWSLNRGQFYRVEDMKFIPLNQLDKAMAAKVASNNPTATGLYAVQFRGAGEKNSHVTATLFRDNVDDFQKLIQNNLSVHNVIESNAPVDYSGLTVKQLRKMATDRQIEGRSKYRTKADLVELLKLQDKRDFNSSMAVPKTVTQNMIDAQIARTVADRSRRNFEGMFQLNSGRGFAYAEEMYGTYNDVNKLFNNVYGRNATKEDILKLIQNEVFEEGGKKITAKQAISRLSSYQRVETFGELYDVFGDTNTTMTKLINSINSNKAINSVGNVSDKFAANYINMQKTLALRNAWGVLQNGNTKMAKRTFADVSGVDILNVSGDKHIRINAANKASAGNGILNSVGSVGKYEIIPSRREYLQVEALKKIAADLEERSLLPENFTKDVIKEGSNPYHVAQAIGGELFNTVDTVKSKTSIQQMIDLDIADSIATNDTEARMIRGYKNATYGLELFDTSSYKIGDTSLDMHLINTGVDIEHVANVAVDNVSPLFALDKSSDGFEALSQYLHNNLGYSTTNVENFKTMLYNEKVGMIGAHDYSVTFFGGTGDKDKMYMAFTDKGHSQSMLQALTDNIHLSEAEQLEELRKIAGVVELSKINKDFPVDSISLGNVEKSVTGSLNTYVAKNKNNELLPAENRVTMRFQDTVDESITNYIPKNKIIAQMIAEGNFEGVNKSINRAFKNPILDGVGLSGIQTVLDNGTLMKKVIPNMSDVASNQLIDMSSSINFLPFLYENDIHLRGELDKLFTPFSGKNAINANGYMERWKKELGANGYGNLRNLEDFDITVQEWFIKNMVKGENILGKIVEHGDELGDKTTVNQLKELLDGGVHQILREDKTAHGFVSKVDRVALNTYGFMTGFARPVQMQFQSFLSYDIDEASKHAKDLDGLGVRLGESVVTHEAREFYHNKMTGELSNIQSTVTANMRQMHTHDLYHALDVTKGKKESILQSFGGKYSTEDFDKVMAQFMTFGDTNMQHSLYHPVLKKAIWNKNELITHKIKDFDEVKFFDLDNNEISRDDLISRNINEVVAKREVDGELREIKYNKDAGTITHIDGDTMYINPTNPQVSELKLGASGVEKSVGSTIELGEHYDELVDAVWRESFGNAAVISNFELGKHLSGSVVAGSYVNYISERMSQMGKEDEFIEMMNKHLPSWDARYVDDNTGRRVLSIAGNPSAEGGHLQGVLDLVNSLKDQDKPHLRQINDELKDMMDKNMYRVSLRRMIMSEMHSAQGAENGKGAKVTPRGNQVLGSNFGMDPEEFRKIAGAEYEKIAAPILERRMDIIRGSREFKEGMDSLKSISSTIQSMMGFENVQGMKNVNLSDLLIPKSGIDADEMSKTLFQVAGEGGHKNVRSFRLNLGDVQVLNPITKKMESVAYIPLIKTQAVDGQVFLTEAQKTVERFMTSLKKLDDGYAGHETIEELQQAANDNYQKMLLSFEHELNHKDGIMEKFLTSGRMPFSGQALGSKVASPVFKEMMDDIENGVDPYESAERIKQMVMEGKSLEFYNPHTTKDVVTIGADGKTAYRDIVYTSEEQLQKMGVNFEDIGEQIAKERLASDGDFYKHISDLGLIGEDGKVLEENFERVGREYLKERGIYGTGMRYPVFKSTSDIAVNLRMDDNLNGSVYHIQGHTAMMWNADVDADRESIILNLEKKDGKVRLLAENDRAEVATRALFDAQAVNNKQHVVAAIDEYMASVDKLATKSGDVGQDLEKYMKFIEDEQGAGILKTDNYLRNDNVLITAIKAKHNKGAIGYISTPNYIVRDIAEEIFKGDKAGMEHLKNIYRLTDETEQKLIDIKHIKNGGEVLTNAPAYGRGLNLLAQGNAEEGLDSIIHAMTGPIFKKVDPETGKIIVPTGKSIIDGTADFSDDMTKALHSLHTLFQDSMASEIWHSPLERNRAGASADDIIQGLTNIYRNANLPDSEINRNKKKLIKESMDADFFTLNGQRIGEKNVLYNVSDEYKQGVYRMSGYDVGGNSKQAFINLTDINSGEELKIYGSSFLDISDKITKNFGIAKRADGAEGTLSDNIQKRFINASLGSYGDFKQHSMEAELIHKSLNGQVEHDKIDLANSIMGKYNSYEQQAIAQTYQDFFGTQNGASVEDFARHTEALKKHNVQNPESLIAQFNEKIRQAGANPRQVKEDMIVDAMNKDGLVSNRQRVISDISRETAQIDEPPVSRSTARTTIQQINDAKLYNLREVAGQLHDNLRGQLGNVDPELISKYGDERLYKMAESKFVHTELNKARSHNVAELENLQKNYANLIEDGSEEAMSFLNWNSKDVVNSYIDDKNIEALGEARIAFGQHIGQRINDLSIADLRGIHSMSTEGVPTEYLRAMRETQERVGEYFSVLDDLGKGESAPIMDRVTAKMGSTLGEDQLSQIGDINDAIRKAGAEAAQAETKTIESATAEVAEVASKAGHGRTAKVLAGAGIALGLASVLAGTQFTAPPTALEPTRRPNGQGSPDSNGNYDERPQVTPRVAPPTGSEQRAIVGSGVNYKVRAKSDGSHNNESVLAAIKHTISKFSGPNLNVNVNTQDDTSGVSDSWLQEKISSLLK